MRKAENPARTAVAEAALRALDRGDVAAFDWNLATGDFNLRGPWERILGPLPEREEDRIPWFLGLVHPDDRDRLVAVTTAGTENAALDLTFRIKSTSGEVRWLATRGGVAPREGTDELCLSGVMLDVTESIRERTELNDALARSEQVLRSVVENAPATIQTIDRTGRILTSNQPVVGRSIFEFTAEPSHAPLRDLLRRVFDERQTCYLEGESPGLGYFGGRYAPVVEHDEVVAAAVVVSDVSEKHLEHLAIRDSEARFREMAESSPLAIWRAGLDMGCTYVNSEFLRFAGRTFEDMEGPRWAELIHADDRAGALASWSRAFEEKESFSFEANFRRADGEYRLMLASGRPILRADGTFDGYAGTCVDLTDLRRAEETTEMQRSELANALRLASMDQMAAGLAHELHQPLAAISAATGAALREIADGGASSDRLREMVDEARRQALRAGTLLGHMRDFIRKSPRESAAIAVDEVVSTVVELVRRESQRLRIVLDVRTEPGLPTTTGDVIQIQQVLINLVQNAFHAVRDADEVDRVVRIRAFRDERASVCVSVTDRGPGFEPEISDQMFDVFFTTKSEGLGMGLAISRSIVEAHGGTLEATNAPEGGARFDLSLPVRAAGGVGV